MVTVELTDEQFAQLKPLFDLHKQNATPEKPCAIVAQVWMYTYWAHQEPVSADLKCWFVPADAAIEIGAIIKRVHAAQQQNAVDRALPEGSAAASETPGN